MSNLSMDFKGEMQPNGQLYFFTTFNRELTTQERNAMPTVNLSRGGVRPYSLNEVSAHNGSGANWKDGASIHTSSALKAYTDRVQKDVANAWQQFKNTMVQVKANAEKAAAEAKAKEEAAKKVDFNFHFNGA